jgi:chromosome segregation protein
LTAQLTAARAAAGSERLEGVDGVLGPFVDHLEIEPGMEAAVAGALGDALRAVVVERGDSLYDAFERLEQADAGALLLVVDRFGASPSQGALVPPGARRLADFVRSSVPGLQSVIERLLAHCVLVDGWLRALDLVVDHPELVAVTRAGDRIGGVEPWRFGSHEAPVVTQAVADEAVTHATHAEVERADAQRAVDTARAALAAARAAEVRRATVEERRSVLQTRLAEVEARLAGRDEHAQETARRHREAILTRDASYHALAQQLESFLGSVATLTDRLRARRQQRVDRARASAEQLEVFRKSRAGMERDLAGIRERASRVEIDDAETRLRLTTAIDAIRGEFDCEPAVALDAPAPAVPEGTTLAGRARELERDLRLMGPVNPLALEEHRALQERHEFLQEQLDDVRTTRRELNRVIRAVDQEIVTIFQQAFADVAEHFASLFATLFPGGSGRISLVDPDDLLDTGIEIEARPSGKNVRRLSLLSGGERSLAALAYLFAVFRARPSPFYLLDEAEAALDDVNLHRFVELVHEFRDEAQLVIVTHQKRTMEAADVLYGVSMPPGGSTRVVSQRVTGELVALER